jgi:hypothetical protein
VIRWDQTISHQTVGICFLVISGRNQSRRSQLSEVLLSPGVKVTVTVTPWSADEWIAKWKPLIAAWNGQSIEQPELLTAAERANRADNMDRVMTAIDENCRQADVELDDHAYRLRVRRFFREAYYGDFGITQTH